MNIIDTLKTIAPFLGTALGSPLAGIAISSAASALGASDKTKKSIETAFTGATPEQLLALKKADQDFQIQLETLGFKDIEALEALAVDDRKDARAMEINTHSKIPAVLSIGITIGYFSILIGLMTKWFIVSDSQALLILLGSLSTAWVSVIAFWFGTTRSSEVKTNLLSKAEPIK